MSPRVVPVSWPAVGSTKRWVLTASGQPGPEQPLAEFGAFAAVGLRLAEKVCQLSIRGLGGVMDVGLQPDRIAQAGLHVPDKVVVLIRGTGYYVGVISLHGLIPL